MSRLLLFLGILFLVYDLGILFYAGIHASFTWFWAGAGFLCLLASAVCRGGTLQAAFLHIPHAVRISAVVFFAAGILLFAASEALVISGMTSVPEKGADYLIVLGAQVRGTKVSRALKQRLDRAAEYLAENEETFVIVSGGQGNGEDISEAEAMAEYLIETGIDEARILKEDRSVNTVQNIRFSRKLIEEETPLIGVVSNDFHVFRAVHIAKAQGISAFGVPAPTELFMRPHYMAREALALAKDLFLGNAAL